MKFDFLYTNELVNYLLKIEKYKTAINLLCLPTRVKQELIYKAKLKKTHFSTSIEGNILNIHQVENVIKDKSDNKRLSGEQEVQNYWDALTFLDESKKNDVPITKEFIFELHDIIEKKNNNVKRINFRLPTPPGVLFAVYDSKTRQPEYIPPESKDIDNLINELISWYNVNENLPVVIKAAIMSYAFVSIHPFDDGNGRTSRALATYVLMLGDYDFKGFNSFEEYYMMDLDGYYNSLQMDLPILFYDGRENPPHLEIWLTYFSKILSINAEAIYDLAVESTKSTNNEILNNYDKKDLVLIRYCLENKIQNIKTKELSVLFGVTPRAITKWAINWMKKDILIPNKVKERITSYALNPNLSNLKVSDLGYTD